MSNHLEIQEITVHEVNKIKNQQPDLHLIDVREPHEWEFMHIPGATHLPKDQLSACITGIVADKTAPIYLYCQGGVRSLQAAQMLKELGYNHLYSMKGGLMEWSIFGYPVEKGD